MRGGQARGVVERDLLLSGDRDDLLGDDVERVLQDPGLLDRAVVHPARDDRGLEQVGPKLREDAALRRLATRRGCSRSSRHAGARSRPTWAARPGRRSRCCRIDTTRERRVARRGPGSPRLPGAPRPRAAARVRATRGVLARPRARRARSAAGRDAPARRRLLTKTIVERWASTARGSSRVDRRPDRVALARLAHVLERNDDLKVELLAKGPRRRARSADRPRRSGRSRRADAGSPRARR